MFANGTETWQISKELRLNDGFKNVKKIFTIDENQFFYNINKKIRKTEDNKEYFNLWNNMLNLVKFPSLDFTHMNVIKKLIEKMPNDVVIHTSVLDAIRITNYYSLPEGVKCFGNIGADGIDGALSTFLGQASQNIDKLAFLIIGDLSFIYDINAMYIDIPSNVRILVINNYAGSEFYRNFGTDKIPTLREYIAAGHNSSMKNIAKIANYIYMCVTNEAELEEALNKFINACDKPILLEAITDADSDARKLTEFWELNKPTFQTMKTKLKQWLKKFLNPKMKDKIKSILRR